MVGPAVDLARGQDRSPHMLPRAGLAPGALPGAMLPPRAGGVTDRDQVCAADRRDPGCGGGSPGQSAFDVRTAQRRSVSAAQAAGTVAGAAGLAGLAWLHAARTRGAGRALLFAALGLGAGTGGEYLAINVVPRVRHHTRPRLLGVPLAAVLSWYTIAYAAFDVADAALGRRGGRWERVGLTALLATSLDLLLDVYGLAHGLWEWHLDGAYAREVAGPNGRRGIPVENFLGWLAMTGGIASAYLLLGRERPPRPGPAVDGDKPRPGAPGGPVRREESGAPLRRDADARPVREGTGPARRAGRHGPVGGAGSRGLARRGLGGGLLLAAYYLPAAAWAVRSGRTRYLAYSALAPLGILLGLRGAARE